MALVHGQSVLIGETILSDKLRRSAVVMREGKICEVAVEPRSGDLLGEGREVPGVICPGFIDLQINGAFGIDIGPDQADIETLAGMLPRTGTTSFLPTAISWPAERYEVFLEMVARASSAPGARILGAHLEGPFLSRSRKGAHEPENLRPVDLGLARDILSSGSVRVMTLAPELPSAGKLVELLCESGVVASMGHSDATYEQALRGIDEGISKATHLYNAMSSFAHRAPGTAGAVLTDDRIRAGIIADGVHVHEGALRLAYREKGSEGLALVTDAMEAAGMPDGEYELSGRTVRLRNGSVRLPDGTLAGSALTLDQAVRNGVTFLGLRLEEAVRMSSETPARILGLQSKGRITSGADADLTILSPEGIVEETIVAGRTVYRRSEKDHGGRE